MRDVICLLIGLLPASRLKNALLNRAARSWRVAADARIGPSIFWRIEQLTIDDRATIGVLNVFREMRRLQVGSGALIGNFNWFSAAAHIRVPEVHDLYRGFVMESEAAITARHYLECSGGLQIGLRSTVSGVRTTILSHGPNVATGAMEAKPVVIGDFSLVGAACTILAGCSIVDCAVVAAGSVVAEDLVKTRSLYGGTPARFIKEIGDSPYFSRTGLRIDPTSTWDVA